MQTPLRPLLSQPKTPDAYRDCMKSLYQGLGKEAGLNETCKTLRGLIDKNVLEPHSDGLDIALHGALAGLLCQAVGMALKQAMGTLKRSARAISHHIKGI